MNESAKRKSMVAQYSAAQIFYWMFSCCTAGYGAVFLRDRGFTNTSLGMILAFANIFGLLLSSVLASVIDRSKRINVFHCLFSCMALAFVLDVMLIFVKGNGLTVAGTTILLYSTTAAVQPLINELCFYLDHTGRYIKYGFSRSMGSLFYVPTTFLVGKLCSRLSGDILPELALITVLMLSAVFFVILRLRKKSSPGEADRSRPGGQGVTMAQFIKNNKRYFVFCIGMTAVFYSQFMTSNFMINIVEDLGGDAAGVGIMQALNAAWEIPFMLCYTRITRNLHCSTVIIFASVMSVIKVLAIARVPTLTGYYLLSVTQGLTYALLTPALVDYASIVVSYKDSAKAQSFSISTNTLATMLSALIGGAMLDAMSVKSVLLISACVCCAGTLVTVLAVDRKKA